MRETVVIERAFDAPSTHAELVAREQAVSECLRDHNVIAGCSYVALDGRAAVCLYEAPDAEAVRATQRRADLPVERAWTGVLVGAQVPPPADSTVIIVQREFAEPLTIPFMQATLRERGHCMDLHRVTLYTTHLSSDGRRAVCVFLAPDTESVRMANQQMQFVVTRAWPARVHHAG